MWLQRIALALMLVAAAGVPCGAAFEEEADIRGVITDIRPAEAGRGDGDQLGTVLIEGEGRYDRASVSVNRRTRLHKLERGRRRPASFDDLGAGKTVRAWFDGPVMESYPVRATAGVIVILEARDVK